MMHPAGTCRGFRDKSLKHKEKLNPKRIFFLKPFSETTISVVFSASHLRKRDFVVFGLGGAAAQTEHYISFFCLQRIYRNDYFGFFG